MQRLLSAQSIRERETKKVGEEIMELLSKPTAKEQSLAQRFRSQGGIGFFSNYILCSYFTCILDFLFWWWWCLGVTRYKGHHYITFAKESIIVWCWLKTKTHEGGALGLYLYRFGQY